jgi:hypothetical protein
MDKIAKAIAAALFAALAMFEAVNVDEVITGNEWVRIVVSLVGAGVTTWLIPNANLVTPQMVADYLRDRPEVAAAAVRTIAADLETARVEALKSRALSPGDVHPIE